MNTENSLGNQRLLNEVPDITVITPSYNYAQYIEECVNSVKSVSAEIKVLHIVQDGNSTDNTIAKLEGLSNRTLLVQSGKDEGQSDALNKALSLVNDDSIVGWLNADEYYLPGALDVVYRAAQKSPRVDVFFGDCIFVDKDGKVIRAVPAHIMSRFVLQHYGCFISSCTFFVRASALKKVGWDTNFRRAMDWDLYLALSAKHKFKYIKFNAGAFRVHLAQVTNTPESHDIQEFINLRTKHNINKNLMTTVLARLIHVFLKILGGGYAKQLSFMRRRGQKLTSSGFLAESSHDKN